MIYAAVLQTKPAHYFKCAQPWTPGRPFVNVAWHRSTIEKLLVGWRQSEKGWTLTGKEGLQSCSGFGMTMNEYQALLGRRRPGTAWPWVPGCLLWPCPVTSFFPELCNEPLSLKQNFPNLLGHRTVFILITQQEHMSYKCESPTIWILVWISFKRQIIT